MSGQKWEPGTVAWVEGLSVMGSVCSGWANYMDGHITGWRALDNVWTVNSPTAIRPLLVLDPDDEDQMRGLAHAIWADRTLVRTDFDQVAAAVRAMLPKPLPTKPEEPTGLGAVVEFYVDGERWVRFEARSGSWWRNKAGVDQRWSHFPDTVTVLSEGVES